MANVSHMVAETQERLADGPRDGRITLRNPFRRMWLVEIILRGLDDTSGQLTRRCVRKCAIGLFFDPFPELQLPIGWVVAWSNKNKRHYFFDTANNKTSWLPPEGTIDSSRRPDTPESVAHAGVALSPAASATIATTATGRQPPK